MTKIIGLFFMLFISSTAFAQQKKVLNVADFKKETKNGDVLILDVRTPDEYKAGHIKNAINIDWKNSEEFKNRAANLEKTKSIYIYCRSGARSQKAAEWLSANGFENVTDLNGGIEAWQAAGKRVKKSEKVRN